MSRRDNLMVRFLLFATLFAGIGYFFLTRVAWFWAGGADHAHHIIITSRHMEGLDLLTTPGGEQAAASPYAHIAAAIVGKIFGSPVIGVEIVALASFITIWLLVFLRADPGSC